MSLTIHHKYKYFHSTVQRATDRRPKFHFCRLPFDVPPLNVKLNLSNSYTTTKKLNFSGPCRRALPAKLTNHSARTNLEI